MRESAHRTAAENVIAGLTACRGLDYQGLSDLLTSLSRRELAMAATAALASLAAVIDHNLGGDPGMEYVKHNLRRICQ